jgi:hypothetical protein
MEKTSEILMNCITMGLPMYDIHGLEGFTNSEEYKEMEKIADEIFQLVYPSRKRYKEEGIKYPVPIEAVQKAERLIQYVNLLRHPIHINEFKNKNGNVFYQARASIKDSNGKKVMLNGYIGPSHKFDKGIEDPFAIEIGRKAVLKKLRKFYID